MSIHVKISLLVLFTATACLAEPVPRAGTPGPRMLLGTSVMTDDQNQIVKSLGFSHSQTDSDHLTVNETAPGVWDWSQADAGLAAMQKAGMKWQYFPHFHFAPEWYQKSEKFVPCVGLRSKRRLPAMSVWSPDIVPWFDHCYAALAKHYGSGTSNLYAIYLGVHGDFGETLFPMGFHPDEKKRFGTNAAVMDFWCGDPCARTNFHEFARAKYKRISRLNSAWGTKFKEFSDIDYPPAAYDKNVSVIATPQSRRYWLDFVEWYYDGMTRLTGEVCRIARHYFPDALLELPVGGGSEELMFGQDTTAIPKVAKKYDVHIRSTHGGFKPFGENYAGMVKKIATACKFYGVPHWLEPPGAITPDGEVARLMEAISCGNFGFWDWGANPLTAADTFRQYTNFFTQEKPVVDVALFFPTTDHRLHPHEILPHKLQTIGAELRDVMDFDMADEALIADGALKDYRVLVWIEGSFVEPRTAKKISDWVNHGGVLIWSGTNAFCTIDGNADAARNLIGIDSSMRWSGGGAITYADPKILPHVSKAPEARTEASVQALDRRALPLANCVKGEAIWAMRHHKGWAIVAPALETKTWNALVRDVVYNLSALDKSKRDALEIDNGFDGVYTTLLANDEAILYNSTSAPRTNHIGTTTVVLPPHSLRSALVR